MHPKSDGLLDSSLYVLDVSASARIYARIFGFRMVSDFGVVRSASLHRTMEMASCTSLSRFLPPSWRDGKHGLRRTESLSKRSACGISVARAYTFGIPTAICWKLPRPASGRPIDVVRTVDE
jgi:hypothetical protein